MKQKMGWKSFLCALLFLSLGLALTGCGADEGVKARPSLTEKEAKENLAALLTQVNVKEVPLRMDISGTELSDPGAELPDIAKYPLSVAGTAPVNVEIMASTEKAGPGMDGWLNAVAESFNRSGATASGQKVSVSIRPVASGLATDYITTDRYVPDAFSPANSLWGEIGSALGATMEAFETRLAGNTAGILMSKSAHEKYSAKYGDVTLGQIIEAVMAGDLLLGYTNPYVSSTGLNILTAMLQTFDPQDPLSPAAMERLQAFQAMVPPVAYTTAQMRESAKNGVLDAMIMEYQAYINEPSLKDYVFTPCGVRHDNPVYVTGNLTADQRDALRLFADYCKGDWAQKEAARFGFNANDDYPGQPIRLNGNKLAAAQQVWKKSKDGGRPVVAVFVTDVSGSMGGSPIQQLTSSLVNASGYIGAGNYIGLISYANDVSVNLPIAEFDGPQKAYFNGAVRDLSAGGGTATYDAVLVGLDMLLTSRDKIPNAKLMLFVLSDGAQNQGYSLDKITPVVRGLGIPIYTFGYNIAGEDAEKKSAREALKTLSSINEASTISADEGDVVYNLRNFFNAQM